MTGRRASKAKSETPEAAPRPGFVDPAALPGIAVLPRVHLFPVRHHSPRSSAALEAFLARVDPKVILVEGPDDATHLVEVLVDRETTPPIAILGYRTDGTPASSLWPFAAYSPEYVALKWGVAHGRKVGFIDVPIGRSLATHEPIEQPGEIDIEEDDLTLASASGHGGSEGDGEPSVDVQQACATARGFRSFEEFWEASFEAPSYEPEAFRQALLAYADLVRAADRRAIHLARDAYMARRILEEIASGTRPEQIVAVLGAAHAAAFAAADVDLRLEQALPAPVPSAATVIPFSFPRLAEQLGYGAGNRAPQYYQRAHDAGCDYRRATLEVLVEFTEHLRLRGYMASLADTIEAYRLAVTLAEIRGKAEPGLDELREATVATLCRGDATHVDGFLWPSVIGRNVGKVGGRIGKNSLQQEFWREVEQRHLPSKDESQSFALKLNDPVQVATSVFLHRLRISGIPYAAYIGKQVGALGNSTVRAARDEEAGGLDALRRIAEAWEAQWTPATDVALVEKIVLGDTIEQVATRLLEEGLAAAHTTADAAEVLLEAVVTSASKVVRSAITAGDRFASSDSDLYSLARAASIYAGIVSLGSSRSLITGGDVAIQALCEKTFARAVLRIEDACTGNEDAVVKPKDALRMLHDVALKQPTVDRDAWFEAAARLVKSYVVNPGASGLACGLLYLAQMLNDDDVARIVEQRLSNTLDPAGAAGFLQGFFEVNALALVKSRPVIQALDRFLNGIAPERFRDALPILRRAFSPLGPTERRYLLENVLGVRSIGDRAREAQAILLEKDREKLKAMSDDLAKAMDDLDDLL